jgi:hypothetical protein
MFKTHRLNLSPAFQRQSVWTKSDRQLLVRSLLEGVPLPSIYLYRTVGHGGVPKYDVIDGKQRLETILQFLGKGPLAKDQELLVKTSFADDDQLEWWSWRDFSNEEKNKFLTAKIQTIEVAGDLSEIIGLFVRINSTGKRLTMQEKRHANFYTNPVLKTAQKLAADERTRLMKLGVVTPGQAARMKDVELVTELLLAINAGQPLNKKSKIDRVIQGSGLTAPELQYAAKKLKSALALVEVMLPDLRSTRLSNGSDFYTLILLLHRLKDEGKSVSAHDSKRNALAGSLLRGFAHNVDELSDQLKNIEPPHAANEPVREYLMTVRADTDSSKQRLKREKILTKVLDGVFEDLDPNRVFNSTQRRIVWNGSHSKSCAMCRRPVKRWEDMAVDHMNPYINGGKTVLGNAALTHKNCNAAAGAKFKQ